MHFEGITIFNEKLLKPRKPKYQLPKSTFNAENFICRFCSENDNDLHRTCDFFQGEVCGDTRLRAFVDFSHQHLR